MIHAPEPDPAATQQEAEFHARLAEFRARIDAMDDELIALINDRCDIVAQVGALKRAHLDTRCFIRPAREALMIRRIAAQFEAHAFSSAAAAAIWRLIIAASTSLEQPLRITSYFQPNAQESYWLAREYFGSFSNVVKETVPSRVIGHVMDGKALVGVLPALDAGNEDAWWKLLPRGEVNPRPSIFACLPYAFMEDPLHQPGSPLRPAALAVGYVDCEPTGDDVTYIVIESKHELSQSRIHGHFQQFPLPARWLQVIQEPETDSRLHLIELEGFIERTHSALTSLHEQCRDQLHGITVLGAHAKPVLLTN